MTKVINNLETISNGYSVFEKDQMLTHSDLNRITEYFEDQTRLAKVKLSGVGILNGLRPSLASNKITITKGHGITTDGDLLVFNTDTQFDSYIVYEKTEPVYDQFFVESTIIPLYELTNNVDNNRSTSLSQFATVTGKSFDNMAVVLYMESYIKDSDICTSTDCDNLGKELINTPKILLVEKSNVDKLLKNIPTPHSAFEKLKPIAIERPIFNTKITTPDLLNKSYLAACSNIKTNINKEFSKIYEHCATFISETFFNNPYPGWETVLNNLHASFTANQSGIQYYFSFLTDLSETYNSFLNLLFGDTTLFDTASGNFSKHLVLGNLKHTNSIDENRMLFYPSIISSDTFGNIKHANFLLKKIDVLINSFEIPAVSQLNIKVIPSRTEEVDLEERAIPFYYKPANAYLSWNYRLSQRNMGTYNYSYHASQYGALGGAANPLNTKISNFDFFRIEGHIGQNITTVHNNIETQIKEQNLPFALRAIFLDTDRTKIVIRPPLRYTDLHRFHYILRQDVVHQMTEVVDFNSHFKTKVNEAITDKVINNQTDTSDTESVSQITEAKSSTIQFNADLVAKKMMPMSYNEYKKDKSWQNDLANTVKTGGEFKKSLGKVVKTEFSTPFDNLASNTHIQWIDWLDDLIKKKDDKEDDKLLFANFAKIHPGVEHCGGVYRGGTFVLIYDINNKVIADFTLPYYAPETADEDDNEPELKRPIFRGDWIKDSIKIQRSIDNKFIDKLDDFKIKNVDILKKNILDFDDKLEKQKTDYFNTIKESYTLMGNVVTTKRDILGGSNALNFSDPELDILVNKSKTISKEVEYYTSKANAAGISAEEKASYENKASEAQEELAKTVGEATTHLAKSGGNISMGSESFNALIELNSNAGAIKSDTAKTKLNTALNTVKTGLAAGSNMNMLIGNMMR